MEGEALLIAGHGADEVEDPRLPLITQLGEAVLASASPWRVRRLAAGGPERDAPSRGNVRRELDAVLSRPAIGRIVVIAAELTRTIEGLGVLCGRREGFEEDASVSLAWFANRLQRASNVPTAFLVVAPSSKLDPKACLEVLRTAASEHVVAVAAGDPLELLRTVIDGLWSEAIDLATGSITPSSLGRYLERRLPDAALQLSTSISTLLVPRGLVRIDLAERAHERLDAGSDELIGAVLPGQYRVASELGRGNFGVIYRAHHELMDREVAIKVLPARLDVEASRRFALEIRTVCKLNHPNVVRVLHSDVTRDGRMFVAMELLAGPTLQEVIARGALAPAAALELTRQLLAGLAAAHDSGFVHADVKPANLMYVEREHPRVVLLDFGFSCLRAERSVGGTPAFMPPEQYRGDRIEASADVYAAALVALALASGKQSLDPAARTEAIELFESRVAAVLRRALRDDPAARFASADEMLAELAGEQPVPRSVRPPFRVAAPFSEQERDDFHGRAHEVERLLEHVLFHRAVVYVAPSGTGKTSLLLAGLVPRLRDLDVDVEYVSYRAVGSSTIGGAIAQRLREPSSRRLVVIIDQVEAAVSDAHGEAVLEGLEMPAWPTDAPISVVWTVREEYLARLLDRVRKIEPGVPIVRLGPLTPETAAQIIRLTFERRGVKVEPSLIDTLVADLGNAAARLGVELGWGETPAVYPPHLQLAGAVLDEAREGGAIDLALYREVGGFQTILGEHLRQVLEGELEAADTAIARDLFVELMTSSRSQVACKERDLIARVGRPTEIQKVLQFLRDRGLLVTARGAGGEPVWDLAHDSLGTQIEAWMTTTDAARRRAMDLVRYHLDRSTLELPSHLGVAELREVRDHLDARELTALDAEWKERLGDLPARRLLDASRRAIRSRRVALGAFGLTAVAIAAVFASRWMDGRREITLRDRDIGETRLVLRAFDWDPATLSAIDVAAADFRVELAHPATDDPDLPGAPFADDELSTEALPSTNATRITARGGPAVLVIGRTDRAGMPCSPVVVPVRRLPGYNQTRDLTLRIPTCEASASDMIPIPAGPFLSEGVGDPPASDLEKSKSVGRRRELPSYALDRTEVPNALVAVMAEALAASDRRLPIYPHSYGLEDAGAPDRPVASFTRNEAAAVCRLLGKRLPTSFEWQKAARGGTTLDGKPNRFPMRNLPWGPELELARANVKRGDSAAPTPVGAFPTDVGPYGHLDLAGNVSEWTASVQPDGLAIMRGGNWEQADQSNLANFCAIENPREPKVAMYTIGFRCAGELTVTQLHAQRTVGREVQVESAMLSRPEPE
jgi:serine/threonine protein kinase/formylglycine-generating enzyme required for sulfatase activity